MIPPAPEGYQTAKATSDRVWMPFLLALGLGIRLFVSRFDGYVLFQKCVVDDAYFYFGIARHIAMGTGATFDGSIMTNGFHVIYALLLVPVFWIFPHSASAPLHMALAILSLFSVGTGLVIYLVVRELSGRRAGTIAAFLWLFNPYVILISLSGVEVAVSTFFLSLCVYLYVRIRKEEYHAGRTMVLGCVTGLAILSRVDSIFMLASIGLDMLVSSLRGKGLMRTRLSRPFIYAATTLAVLSPWLAWSYFRFGTIRQISGVTLPNIAHTMYLDRNETYLSWSLIKTELFHLKLWSLNILQYSGGIWLFLLVITWAWWTVRRQAAEEFRRILGNVRTAGFAFLSAAMLVSFYALYFWGWLRPWYYLSVVLVMTIGLGILVSTIVGSSGPGRLLSGRVVVLAAAMAACLYYQGASAWRGGLFGFQKQLYDSALWLNTHTGSDEKIAAISAGICGFVTRRTVDLAGVVNEEAYRAMREKRIFAYLLEKRISYLADREDMIRFYSRRFDREGFMDRLVEVKRFGDEMSDIVVYRISPAVPR